MQIIGITGGIGSGKSTIARELVKRGFAVYDCDREAKRIIAENPDVQKEIIDLLGEEAFIKSPITNHKSPITNHQSPITNHQSPITNHQSPITNHQSPITNHQSPITNHQSPIYNTAYVAQRVFADETLLPKLNSIIHPAVGLDIMKRQPDFVESAILFESGLNLLCNRIIVIDAPEDIRIARTIARDYQGDASPANINKVRARIHAQHIPQGDLTLLNDGHTPIEEIVDEILAVY